MSDIADKIYAATGLTLGAEAAAKVGHMIRLARQEAADGQEAADEIEKLQAENAKFAASNHAYLSDYQEARGEIEKLRAAICEWAASIYGYEGVLFLEGLKHEKFINSILDAERDRVEGEQKE